MSLWRDWVKSRVADPSERVLQKRINRAIVADVVLGVGLVWLSLMVQDLGYRIETVGRLIEKLDMEHSELTAELAAATSPEKIRNAAGERFALTSARPGQVVPVHD